MEHENANERINAVRGELTKEQAIDILLYIKPLKSGIRSRCAELDRLLTHIQSVPVETLIRMSAADAAREWERIEKEAEREIPNLRTEIAELQLKLARLTRLETCMDTLPPDEIEVLRSMYVEGKGWKELQVNYSSTYIRTRKKNGLDHLVRLYNSDFSDSYIKRHMFLDFFSSRDGRKKSKWTSNQESELESESRKKEKEPQKADVLTVHQVTVEELLGMDNASSM